MYRKEVLNMFYLGLDYSKRFSIATVLDGKGRVIKEGKLQNRRADYEEFFRGMRRVKAVMEAGRNYHVGAELLEGLVEEIKLAHPLKVRAIAEAKIKTDSIDSLTLAQLLRGNLIPEAYFRDREERERQGVLHLRSFFVRQRTAIRNRIHCLIDGQGEEVRDGVRRFSDLYGKSGKAWLRQLDLGGKANEGLRELLEQEEHFGERIKNSDKIVQEIYNADEDCKRIDSIPGFGVFLSVLAKVEIGTISRFKSASHLCSYAGLVPSTYSSGGKTRHGKIVKGGNRNLRWCLVEAANHCLKDKGGLGAFYSRIRRKKGNKIARVAAARKLCCILYRVLNCKDTYKVFRKNKQSRLRSAPGVPL
jgi:transposase